MNILLWVSNSINEVSSSVPHVQDMASYDSFVCSDSVPESESSTFPGFKVIMRNFVLSINGGYENTTIVDDVKFDSVGKKMSLEGWNVARLKAKVSG